MKKYELMYILPNATSDELKEDLTSKINALVEKNGGVIEQIEKLGNKKLAYEIEKNREGYYVLINFSMEPANVKALTSVLAITDNVLRYIVVAK